MWQFNWNCPLKFIESHLRAILTQQEDSYIYEECRVSVITHIIWSRSYLKWFDYNMLTLSFLGHNWRLLAKCHGKCRRHSNVRSLTCSFPCEKARTYVYLAKWCLHVFACQPGALFFGECQPVLVVWGSVDLLCGKLHSNTWDKNISCHLNYTEMCCCYLCIVK